MKSLNTLFATLLLTGAGTALAASSVAWPSIGTSSSKVRPLAGAMMVNARKRALRVFRAIGVLGPSSSANSVRSGSEDGGCAGEGGAVAGDGSACDMPRSYVSP